MTDSAVYIAIIRVMAQPICTRYMLVNGQAGFHRRRADGNRYAQVVWRKVPMNLAGREKRGGRFR